MKMILVSSKKGWHLFLYLSYMLAEEKSTRLKRIGHALRLRCPNCGSATVFYKSSFQVGRPKLKETCDKCGYHFVREPGFFKGAILLSLALSAIIGLLLAAAARLLIFGLSDRELILIGLAGAFFTSAYTYRFARILWLSFHV